MSELETGHKWWIRYVAVPVIVGLLALLVVLNRRSATSDQVLKVPPPSAQGDEKTESIVVEGKGVDVTILDNLYVADEHDQTFVKDVRVRKGSVFTVKWDARDTSSGQLHLLLIGANGHTIANQKIGAMGLQKVSTDYLITLKLVEEHNGKLRLIKSLPVQVF